MYKPGTQLIINELWARETAEKLGFELTGGYRTVEGTWFPHRIVVTSEGPNAAERVSKLHSNLITAAVILGLPRFSEVIEP